LALIEHQVVESRYGLFVLFQPFRHRSLQSVFCTPKSWADFRQTLIRILRRSFDEDTTRRQ
jgi:hypothetical protein